MAGLKKGTQIIYVPLHAEGDIDHPDCEAGFVTSQRGNTVFCRYWRKGEPGILRTTACSEGCDEEFLVIRNTVWQQVVQDWLDAIEKDNVEFQQAWEKKYG